MFFNRKIIIDSTNILSKISFALDWRVQEKNILFHLVWKKHWKRDVTLRTLSVTKMFCYLTYRDTKTVCPVARMKLQTYINSFYIVRYSILIPRLEAASIKQWRWTIASFERFYSFLFLRCNLTLHCKLILRNHMIYTHIHSLKCYYLRQLQFL